MCVFEVCGLVCEGLVFYEASVCRGLVCLRQFPVFRFPTKGFQSTVQRCSRVCYGTLYLALSPSFLRVSKGSSTIELRTRVVGYLRGVSCGD